MIIIKCQHCQSPLEIKNEWIGMKSRCPVCHKDILLQPEQSESVRNTAKLSKKLCSIIGGGVLLVIILLMLLFALSGEDAKTENLTEVGSAAPRVEQKVKKTIQLACEQGFKFNEENTGLLEAPADLTGEVIIPDGVVLIGAGAFKNSAITSIIFPESVTKIESEAFRECAQLVEIKFGNSLSHIGNEAFTGCENLAKVSIPDSVTHLGRNAFKSCKNLVELSIGNGVTVIGSGAFRECSKLESVVIPDSVIKIDSGAFWECSALSDVKFGNNLQVIENSAFYSCQKLKKIVLPDSLKTIKNFAFWYCFGLDDVTLGKNITSIGDSAFISCKFKTIKIPAETQLGNLALPQLCKVIRAE